MRILILMLILLLAPISIKAENIEVDCKNKDDYIKCEFLLTSKIEVSAIELHYDIPSSFEKISFEVDKKWLGEEENNIVLLYTDKNKVGKIKIGTLKLKKDDEKIPEININYLMYGDKDFQEHIIIDKNNNINNISNEKSSWLLIIIISFLVICVLAIGVVKMKKRLIINLLILTLAIVPAKAFAIGNATISITCPNVDLGSTANCIIKANITGTKTSGIMGDYAISGGVATIAGTSNTSGFEGGITNGLISLYSDEHVGGQITLGTITIKGEKVGTGMISISNIIVGDEEDKEIGNIQNAQASFKVITETTTTVATTTTTTKKTTTTTAKTTTTSKSTTTNQNIVTNVITTTIPRTTEPHTQAQSLNIKNVSIDNFEVTYNEGVYYATVNSNTEQINVKAEADDGVTILGTGKRTLAVGKNLVELVLANHNTAETKTFQLIVTRPEGENDYNTLLKELSIVGYKFNFKPDKTEYSVSIPNNIKEVYVNAVAYNDNVTVNGAGIKNITSNKDTIYITVSYGNVATTQYVIHISKSYSSVLLIGLSGIFGASFISSIFVGINKNKKLKQLLVAEKNKSLAYQNRQNPTSKVIELNKPQVVSTPNKVIDVQKPVNTLTLETPTRVVKTPTPVTVIKSSPAPQVKVVKTAITPTPVENSLFESNESINEGTN